ncbi:MAG: hypothetical protein ABW162_03605 [Candidatus Sedimenticola sp. PURPLELP]
MVEEQKTESQAYLTAFKGSFTSALRWHNLDDLWAVLKEQAADDWYIYAVGETPPEEASSRDQLFRFVDEIDELLRREHDEDYCGIVYSDTPSEPSFIKIYDPNNLGVSCGYSDNPPLPGWVLSRMKPCDLEADMVLPGNRKRWWRRLFA